MKARASKETLKRRRDMLRCLAWQDKVEVAVFCMRERNQEQEIMLAEYLASATAPSPTFDQ